MRLKNFYNAFSLMILTIFVFTSVLEAVPGSNLRLPIVASNERLEISLKLKDKTRPFADMSLFPVGVGGFWFGRQWNIEYEDPKPEEITSCLNTAFKRLGGAKGRVMIDTASAYGPSETRIGKYLNDHPDKKDKAIIATKWGEDPAKGGNKGKIDYSLANLKSSVARSRKRLGKIDLLYLHGTGSTEDVILALRNRGGVKDEMKRMKDTNYAGIKYIGVSITNEETLNQVVKANLLDDFDVVQVPIGICIDRKDIIEELYAKGKAIVINSPVRWGTRLTGKDAKGIYSDLLSDKRVSMVLNGSRYHFDEDINHAEEAIIEKAKRTLALEKEVEQAMLKWFKPDSGRRAEEKLYEFLVNKGEEAIDAFVRLVEADRGGKKIGHYKINEIIPSKIANTSPGNSPGPDKNMYPMPYELKQYQNERIELMTHVAIQKALGRKVVLNVGIGHVGTAVMMVTSEAKKNLISKIQGKKFRSPLSGEQHVYDVIGYDRPLSFCYYKVPMVKNGDVPIVTADSTPGKIIKQAKKAGNLTATFIPESIGIADIIMVETELHVRKLVPRYLEQDFAVPEPTLKLLEMIGGLKHKDALIIIESTVYPGFSEMDAIPALNNVLRKRGVLKEGEEVNYAYAFQRMRPGIEWISSLKELQRIGAAVAKKPRKMIKKYFENVGFKHLVWDSPKAAEYAKDLENAWTYSQLENMVSYMRAAERLGIDGFKLVKEIVSARLETHQAMLYIPSLQPGGYCVPKEICEMIYGMRRSGMSELEIMEMFGSRLYSAAILDFKGEDVVWDIMEELAEEGISMPEAVITWWGITYKEGNEDTRMAGPERGTRKAAHYGADNIVTDPYATWWREMQQQDLNNPECWGYGLKNQQQLRGLKVLNTQDPYKVIDLRSDAFVLSTRHWQYIGENQPAYMKTELRYEGKKKVHKGLSAIKVAARVMAQEGKVLEDTYNFLSDKDMKVFLGLGWRIRSAGKGHIKKLQDSITAKERIRYNNQLLGELEAMNNSGEFNKEE
ncbi:MAG: aldo/keto reductase, partial [Candidatus Omnitrophica bacterium]|nr:aldo/keto reductase [Candidatus Omnitrophota bacterium]